MADKNKRAGFKTDAFAGALKKNEEMNKNGIAKKDGSVLARNARKGDFTTDAFVEALKINEDRNRKDKPRKD